jgi:hypothetical protein
MAGWMGRSRRDFLAGNADRAAVFARRGSRSFLGYFNKSALEKTVREILKFCCEGTTGARRLVGARPVEQARFTGSTTGKFLSGMGVKGASSLWAASPSERERGSSSQKVCSEVEMILQSKPQKIRPGYEPEEYQLKKCEALFPGNIYRRFDRFGFVSSFAIDIRSMM